jgi:hypothetical protein
MDTLIRFSFSPSCLEHRKSTQADISDETDDHPQQFACASGQISPQISPQISQFLAAHS